MNKIEQIKTTTENGIRGGVDYYIAPTVKEMTDKINELVDKVNQLENASSNPNGTGSL